MKEKKYKIRPQVLIIAGVIVAVLIIAVIAGNIISARNKSKDNTVGMTLTQKNLRPQDAAANSNSTEEKEKTTVEILMDDTAVPVGTTFMAAAIVEPEDTDKALVWTSSNQDIMTVDDSGLVTIKGTGTAALTATVGDVSDAVAIEGIESVTSGSKNGYTVYTGNGSITKSSSSGGSRVADSGSNSGSGSTYNDGSASGGSGSTGSSTSDGSIGSNGSSGNSTGSNSGSNSSSGNTSGSNSGNNSNSGNASYDGGNNSSSGSSNSGSTDNGGSDNSGSNSSNGKTSSDIAEVLDGQGFTQEYSYVYVYTEGDTYYGEIITQPNVAIIYIKQRSGGFDSRIKGVLAQLLPESYDQVWNNYLSATSDRTFTVEGRRVRIVTAARGGHSQIVIYN